MGYRMHVQKKHVIEYADEGIFNWNSNDVNSFLDEFIPGYYGDDENYGPFSKHVELPKDEFEKFLEWFKDDIKREEKFAEHDYDMPKTLKELDINYIVESFQYILDNADPDECYIYLDWF